MQLYHECHLTEKAIKLLEEYTETEKQSKQPMDLLVFNILTELVCLMRLE